VPPSVIDRISPESNRAQNPDPLPVLLRRLGAV